VFTVAGLFGPFETAGVEPEAFVAVVFGRR